MDRNKRLNKVILVKKTVRVNFSLVNPLNIKATISFVNIKPKAKIIIEITNKLAKESPETKLIEKNLKKLHLERYLRS